MEETRECNTCHLIKEISAFKIIKKHWRRRMCTPCRDKTESQRNIRKRDNLAIAKRLREKRQCKEYWPEIIYRDSRNADRKDGRLFDLTKEFIARLISNPCAYCGEHSIRMTLDRIDNSIGHLQTNVNSCCIRCNYIRRDIPYLAWLEIAKSLSAIRQSGLFGTWVGRWTGKVSN